MSATEVTESQAQTKVADDISSNEVEMEDE